MVAVGQKIHLMNGVKAVFWEVLRGSLVSLMYWRNLKLKLRLLKEGTQNVRGEGRSDSES